MPALQRFFSSHPHMKGMALCLLGYFLFSTTDALGKHMMERYDAFTIMFWGGCLALGLMVAFSRFLGGFAQTFRTKALGIHLLRGGILTLNTAAAIYAFGHLPMVDAYTLIFVAPFVVALLSMLVFREHLSRGQMGCILLGFCGVLVAMRPGFAEISLGAWASLSVAFLYSVGFLLSKPLGKTETRLSMAFYPTLLLTIGSLVMLQGMPIVPEMGDWPLFLVRGVLHFAGILAMSMAFSSTPGGLLAPLHYSQLLWGLIIGLLVFGDVPDAFTALGAAIIVGSGFVLMWQERRRVSNKA